MTIIQKILIILACVFSSLTIMRPTQVGTSHDISEIYMPANPHVPVVGCSTIDEYLQQIGPYIRKILESKSWNIPLHLIGWQEDDLVQEGYARVVRALRSHNPGLSQFNTWMIRNLKQLVFDTRRKCKAEKSRRIKICNVESFCSDWSTDGTSVKEWELLQDFSERLSDYEFMILRFRLCGFTISEVAFWLGVSESKVVIVMKRIRDVARRYFGNRRIVSVLG